MKLLGICMEQNYFSFNKKFSEQISVLSMVKHSFFNIYKELHNQMQQ